MIGTFLATEAIKIILNHQSSVMGKMIQINMDTLRFNHISFNQNTDNIECKLPIFEYVTADMLSNDIIIDVREPHELTQNPLIENSISMPLSTLNITDLLSLENPIFKCHTGRRAERIALKLGLLSDSIPRIRIML
jgi:hypothetical protein